MKNSIEGFNQKYATTLQMQVEKNGKIVTRKIDCIDLVILRWFVDFYPNMKKVEVDGKQYAWLTHKKLIEDLPLIDINKRSFIDRMQKLVSFGILTYKLLKETGNFSLYGFGDNYNKLVENDNPYANEQHRVVQSNDIGLCNQTTHEDNSIIDNSIIDSINNIVEYLNKKASTHYKATTPKTKRLIDARFKEGFSLNDFKKVIDNKCKDWLGKDMEQYLRPETLFGTKFESYLNQKPVEIKQEFIHNDYKKEEVQGFYTDLDKVEL